MCRQLALAILLIASLPVSAQEQATEVKEKEPVSPMKLENSVDSLAILQQSIEMKRKSVRALEERLKQTKEPSEKLETEQKIERLRNEIASLQRSFEHVALGGANMSVLAGQPEQKINWRDELDQISRPLIATLKEITAKPRQMDALRRDIERYQEQLEEIDRALESLRSFSQETVPALLAEPINRLWSEWEIRRDDAVRELEIARFKLENLKVEGTTWQASAWEAVTEFLLGRGFTIFLAVCVGFAIWLILKAVLELYWRWLYRMRHAVGATRAPLVIYAYRLFTAVVIVLGVLMVFYIRGDVLLITLALVALAGVALSLRQTLPRYAAELRLLLGVGPVREDERLVYEGIPFKVVSLSVYSILRNPLLEGVLRLPLHAMSEFTSRQVDQEPWFPCRPDDFVLFADGNVGKVLRQSIELVEFMVRDTRVQIRTRDFLGQNIRNLSQEGFGVAATFGIDYQHQAICLDRIPARLREAILSRFEQVGLKDDIKDLLVEFKAAGASSLDYQIYMIMSGQAAKAYFKAQRLVQQACVDACNQEGWVIPFTQITVHTSNEDDRPQHAEALLPYAETTAVTN